MTRSIYITNPRVSLSLATSIRIGGKILVASDALDELAKVTDYAQTD